ncbi:GyrI-like domain-containing protein [Paenibacillus sp. GCM10023248]|uniref:GyrI-like domain-containing protein n=1 Tax=unclassified Paenibacillus TaxID=185978 RepID=UPI0023781D50|nr:GyrI-like domain-containing protein [Paenibacillus sp. MAHUQ-63]MDD9272232.1 GyrI-like domain-containing protein [Paenibacillus sp. MAHUQ-63]
MDKLDLAKADIAYYGALRKPQVIDCEPLWYVSITGKGDPDGETFARATEALYTVSYGVKGIYKAELKDFTVAKLEGLWWVLGDITQALKAPREEWHWKLLIRMPAFVTEQKVAEARAAALRKKKELKIIASVEFERLHEGRCVQMLHVGPYATEPETLDEMDRFMEANHLKKSGLHHEIYLSDPRKVDTSKLRTILRYPVEVVEVGLLR